MNVGEQKKADLITTNETGINVQRDGCWEAFFVT